MERQLTETDPAITALEAAPRSAMLLHSARYNASWANRSVLGVPEAWYRFDAEHGGQLDGLDRPLSGDVWADLRDLLFDPTLGGVWMGYFSYDLGRMIEPDKLAPARPTHWPLVELGWCPNIESFDAAQGQTPCEPATASGLTSNFGRDGYESIVHAAKAYISAGDVFQVNLAQRFRCHFDGDGRALYRRLAATSPAWFGAYLELGDPIHRRAIASISPELFLALEGDQVVTRPIKGTRPTSCTEGELADSGKDQAELNMIVDLMRNDLGRVCEYGSVRVRDARQIETHPTVHHGVATIEGRLHPDRDIVDLLRATLPGGSVTGAPKVRAMQIIDELEPDPRGPYCGCIGFISRHSARLSIAIRTVLIENQTADFCVGAGIVADSDPASEYDETLDKAAAIFQALGLERPA
jgi:para-aminobenzoate synthetase component 1